MTASRLGVLALVPFLAGCALLDDDEFHSEIHKIQRTLPVLVSGPETLPASTAFAFLYFKEEDAGLYVAISSDGYQWTPGNSGAPLMVSSFGLRDPSIARGPDGIYHMVFTGGGPDAIGYASSPDLFSWSPVRAIRIMEFTPGTSACWAPEVAYDEADQRWIIAWSSQVSGCFEETTNLAKANHRLYATTTRDWIRFDPPRLLLDPGYPVIDPAFARTGSGWRLLFKDERDTPDKKQLRLTSGPTPFGPWGRISDALTVHRVEAPAVLHVGSRDIVYFDEYRAGRYGAIRTEDYQGWDDVSKLMSFPPRARHGTFIQIPPDVAARLGKTSGAR
ncbi:MAG: glycoside hydrolase family 43 protein [Phycisphaerae bacterium]|nr:glycoside hydrolase family 43 protein [Phycisphaerae bacterium]